MYLQGYKTEQNVYINILSLLLHEGVVHVNSTQGQTKADSLPGNDKYCQAF